MPPRPCLLFPYPRDRGFSDRGYMKRIVLCLSVCTVVFLSAGLARAGVRAEHAWMRMSPSASDMPVAYMTLRNGSDRAITLVHIHDSRSIQQPASQLYKQAMNLVRKKNTTKAAVLFRKAGAQGNRRAQYQLGLLYARGDGVKKDLVKAREWLRKAAMQGHPKAQFYLGEMYVFGDGGKKDNIKATTWFWLAKTLGDRFAGESLRVMTVKDSPLELAEAKNRAKALWRKMPHDMKIKRDIGMY